MTPLEEIFASDAGEPHLTRAQERQRDFFKALRYMLFLGKDGVMTFTATSNQSIPDSELFSPANNSTIRDVQQAANRAVMLWECVIRDARYRSHSGRK